MYTSVNCAFRLKILVQLSIQFPDYNHKFLDTLKRNCQCIYIFLMIEKNYMFNIKKIIRRKFVFVNISQHKWAQKGLSAGRKILIFSYAIFCIIIDILSIYCCCLWKSTKNTSKIIPKNFFFKKGVLVLVLAVLINHSRNIFVFMDPPCHLYLI